MHDPKHIPVPLALARATVAYLGTRTYTEVVALLGAWDGVVVGWERLEQDRVGDQSNPAPTGAGSASIDGRTGSVSPSVEQVHTPGPSIPIPNGRSDV